jgi:hypothetical protein
MTDKPAMVQYHRLLARTTFPWLLYRGWLPLLIVPINLGIEEARYRDVVRSMLVGLRAEFVRSFRAWNSTLANLIRGALFVLWVLLTVELSERVRSAVLDGPARSTVKYAAPALPEPVSTNQATLPDGAARRTVPTPLQRGGVPASPDQGPAVATTTEPLAQSSLQTSFLAMLLTSVQGDKIDLTTQAYERLRHFVPLIRLKGRVEALPFVDGLHLVTGLALGLLLAAATRTLSLFRYKHVEGAIDEALDALTARVEKRADATSSVALVLGPSMSRSRTVSREVQEPRAVEALLLDVLQRATASELRGPGSPYQSLHLPAPEVIFVFDELDKVGVGEPNRDVLGPGDPALEPGQRTSKLRDLLAELKNLLSTAPAKFIFIGGRDLHDEWLADQTSRTPLLTSIFDVDTYLPSLLTDLGPPTQEHGMEDRIGEFLRKQYDRASALSELHRGNQRKQSWAVFLPSRSAETFPFVRLGAHGLPQEEDRNVDSRGAASRSLVGLLTGKPPAIPIELYCLGTRKSASKGLLESFVLFLAYRSLGQPKRLTELLDSFARDQARFLRPAEVAALDGNHQCDTVLLFGDRERYRIQISAALYRRLRRAFDYRLHHRDDKLVTTAIFLTDFLLKFHQRAFSWANLDRVEDLMDAHSAPDLRAVFERIVGSFAGEMLHPILNGMYDYRFRSEFAKELDYISRQSPEEMAAFNFTRAESERLMAVYAGRLERLRSRAASAPLRELTAGLGELHEFDRDFEGARLRYQEAIGLLDQESAALGKRPSCEAGDTTAPRAAEVEIVYGTARVRLMLQVGMTYEASRNLEGALVQYRNAQLLAESLLKSLIASPSSEARADGAKLLNLLYQPAFAQAWVAEKLRGSADTSTSIVTRALDQLRKELPFCRERTRPVAKSPADIHGSSFALIASELHKKAGDLFFFKGRGMNANEGAGDIERVLHGGEEGFTLWAYYHYAVALHEVRWFLLYRKESSASKFNAWTPVGSKRWPTFGAGVWPDFVFYSLGGTLGDMSDALLCRISIADLGNPPEGMGDLAGEGGALDKAQEEMADWLDDPSEAPAPGIGTWLGTRTLGSSDRVVEFFAGAQQGPPSKASSVPSDEQTQEKKPPEPVHTDAQRMTRALAFSAAAGGFFEEGGHIQEAIREYLQLAQTATEYLWFGAIDRHLRLGFDLSPALLRQLLDAAEWGFRRVARIQARRASRVFWEEAKSSRPSEEYSPGSEQVHAAVCVASTLLVESLLRDTLADRGTVQAEKRRSLERLFFNWAQGRSRDTQPTGEVELALTSLLEAHPYRLINRVRGCRALLNYGVLSKAPGDYSLEARAEDFLSLTTSYDSPLHVTPFSVGISSALIGLDDQALNRLGGHPKSGHQWTPQNRPPRERPGRVHSGVNWVLI